MCTPCECKSDKKGQQIYNQPQLYFPTNLFAKYSPTLYFNVTTSDVKQEHLRMHKLIALSEEDVNPPASTNLPGRITIHGVPNRLIMNLISRYIKLRLELFDLNYNIASDTMTYFDISASITDPAQDTREPYMVNHKSPSQLVVQGTERVIWVLHSDICNFLTRQMLGKSSMCPEWRHFLIRDIKPIV